LNGKNSNWVKINKDEWVFDNKENEFKSVAKIKNEGDKKSIVINGTFYGKRISRSK
jgi:hypothetical protein